MIHTKPLEQVGSSDNAEDVAERISEIIRKFPFEIQNRMIAHILARIEQQRITERDRLQVELREAEQSITSFKKFLSNDNEGTLDPRS